MSRRVAVFVRAHAADEKTLDLLQALSRRDRFQTYVLANESAGPLDFGGYLKVSVSAWDFESAGYACRNQYTMKHLSDVIFPLLMERAPGYTHYAVVEYDVHLQQPDAFDRIVDALEDGEYRDADLVGIDVGPQSPAWHWHAAAEARFGAVVANFFPLVILSARAISYLENERRREAVDRMEAHLSNEPNVSTDANNWVFCEAFVGSALAHAGHFRLVDLNVLLPGAYKASSFNIGPPELFVEGEVYDSETALVHPVCPVEDTLWKRLHFARAGGTLQAFLADLSRGRWPAPPALVSQLRAQANPITEERLLSQHWRFERQDKKVSIPLKFEPGGEIFPVWSENEHGWRLDGSDLLILTRSGEVSTRFRQIDEYKFEGAFLLPWHESVVHQLYAIPPVPDMQTLLTVGSGSKTLTITLNYCGGPFDGSAARWERNDWIASLCADSLRVAERGPDFSWYTDKTKRLVRLITTLAADYHRLLLIGVSSGAYASLLLGELVARSVPNVEVHTFGINPQTVHARDQREHILSAYDPIWRPQMITERCLARADCETTELPAVLSSSATNARHSIYYDRANPIEEFYVSRLPKSDNVALFPIELGLRHVDGVQAIYRTRVMQSAVESLLNHDSQVLPLTVDLDL